MLVLTRRKREEILLSNGVKITIVNVNDGQVKIGIDCDKSIDIVRSELIDPSKKRLYKKKEDKPDIKKNTKKVYSKKDVSFGYKEINVDNNRRINKTTKVTTLRPKRKLINKNKNEE